MPQYDCVTKSYFFQAGDANSQFWHLKIIGEHRTYPPRTAHSANSTPRLRRTAVDGSATLALRRRTAAVHASTARALVGASFGSEPSEDL